LFIFLSFFVNADKTDLENQDYVINHETNSLVNLSDTLILGLVKESI